MGNDIATISKTKWERKTKNVGAQGPHLGGRHQLCTQLGQLGLQQTNVPGCRLVLLSSGHLRGARGSRVARTENGWKKAVAKTEVWNTSRPTPEKLKPCCIA